MPTGNGHAHELAHAVERIGSLPCADLQSFCTVAQSFVKHDRATEGPVVSAHASSYGGILAIISDISATPRPRGGGRAPGGEGGGAGGAVARGGGTRVF